MKQNLNTLINDLIRSKYEELKRTIDLLRPYGLKAINRLLDYKSGRISVNKDINIRDAYEKIDEALIEIGKLHSDYVIDLFDKELDNPKSKDLWTLANIVGKLGNNRALKYLDKGLNYSNEDIRESCISALFKLEGSIKADTYLKALDDISESVQLAGIRGLRMVGDKKAITKLDRYNNSDNSLLKTEARRAIEDINRRDRIKTATNTGFVLFSAECPARHSAESSIMLFKKKYTATSSLRDTAKKKGK